MAKKGNGFGKFVALATVAGVVAAGISYFTKYKSFHKELEENFHDKKKESRFHPLSFPCFKQASSHSKNFSDMGIQPFTPVWATPSMNCFWKIKNKTTIGITARTAPAI